MTMTLLQLCQAMAKQVGLDVPTAVYAGTDRTSVELVECANETGNEIARRVDWGVLRVNQNFVGDDTNQTFTLNSYFQRLTKGSGVLYTQTLTNIRQLTIGEWASLSAQIGASRYFLLEGLSMQFWPYVPTGRTVRVKYQSANWATDGATKTAKFTADTDYPLVPSEPFLMGMIVRWRRQKGMDYADYEAEYEAALKDFADFDEGSRL